MKNLVLLGLGILMTCLSPKRAVAEEQFPAFRACVDAAGTVSEDLVGALTRRQAAYLGCFLKVDRAGHLGNADLCFEAANHTPSYLTDVFAHQYCFQKWAPSASVGACTAMAKQVQTSREQSKQNLSLSSWGLPIRDGAEVARLFGEGGNVSSKFSVMDEYGEVCMKAAVKSPARTPQDDRSPRQNPSSTREPARILTAAQKEACRLSTEIAWQDFEGARNQWKNANSDLLQAYRVLQSKLGPSHRKLAVLDNKDILDSLLKKVNADSDVVALQKSGARRENACGKGMIRKTKARLFQELCLAPAATLDGVGADQCDVADSFYGNQDEVCVPKGGVTRSQMIPGAAGLSSPSEQVQGVLKASFAEGGVMRIQRGNIVNGEFKALADGNVEIKVSVKASAQEEDAALAAYIDSDAMGEGWEATFRRRVDSICLFSVNPGKGAQGVASSGAQSTRAGKSIGGTVVSSANDGASAASGSSR